MDDANDLSTKHEMLPKGHKAGIVYVGKSAGKSTGLSPNHKMDAEKKAREILNSLLARKWAVNRYDYENMEPDDIATITQALKEKDAEIEKLNSLENLMHKRSCTFNQNQALVKRVDALRSALKVGIEAMKKDTSGSYNCTCGEFGEHWTCEMHVAIEQALKTMEEALGEK